MKNPEEYYQKQLVFYREKLSKLKSKSLYVSILRFVIFLLLLLFVYRNYTSMNALLLIAAIGIPIFLYLVSKSENIKQDIAKTKEFININEIELRVLAQKFDFLPSGKEFVNAEHHFSYDIDLFGQSSFFQYLNRSLKQSSKSALANLLTSNNIEKIALKQEAVKELASKADWRQDFMVSSRLDGSNYNPQQVYGWMQRYTSFTKKPVYYGSMAFSIASILVIIAFFMDIISPKLFTLWVIFGLGLVGKYAKKIHKLSAELDLIKPSFQSYKQLVTLIENESFLSEILQQKKQTVVTEGKNIVENIGDFLQLYQQKDFSNNLIIKFIGNAFFLYDLWMAYRLEQWIDKHKNEVLNWFEVADFFEAYVNLGNFSFNHQNYIYPNIVSSGTAIDARQFAHPLIDKSKRIDNDFSINQHEFYIITGANMAGKSTFLRTVSLGIVMANTGLPVCANHFDYHPIKLITSMRTKDSLSKDESYFFSELKRLQFMVGEMQNEEYFIVLDEILKGTNSKDKAIGSQKFVEKLLQSKSTGIIATHDLSLCDLADDYKQIKNYFFDAEIINDELYFDYRLKTGICQNMNASFLLKKMGIV
jgi:ABC-type multidrug transport system fused ATPase/permease subunit